VAALSYTATSNPAAPSGVGQGSSTAPAAGSNRLHLRAEPVANGLHEPTDAAFTPDGRLFIAERGGEVVVERDRQVTTALSLVDVWTANQNGLVAIATDPQFERTRFVYLLYSAQSLSGDPVFRLARFREVRLVPERFPVKSRLHGGWKGTLYNTVFVGAFNAVPRFLVRRFGWHLLAFCSR
jgi:glucose/arabinose dehydrogenase